MKRLICISTGNFYSPISTGDYMLIHDMNKVIKMCSKLDIDGVELLFGDAKDLMKFKLNKESIKILKNLEFNTIHVPFKSSDKKVVFSNNKPCKRILAKIYRLYDQIDAKNINIHPHQIKNFKIFDTKNYQHSIENMEIHHNFNLDYYDKILKENPSFKLVLDTTHALEGKELNKLFKKFNKKIIYSHLSANYFNHLHIPLHALNKEYLKPIKIIKKGNFPIILEAQIGTKNIDEYKKEVDFVRKWLK